MPTRNQLRAAHLRFEKVEPRACIYRAAIEFVDSAWNRRTELTITDALAVFLQSWNQSFYRYRPFTEKHYSRLESLLKSTRSSIAGYRNREIQSLTARDHNPVKRIFAEYERVLYPVGAAKALHMLAPAFFPLWDRKIASGYRLALDVRGRNAEKYWRFMQIARHQTLWICGSHVGDNSLKALDEYNYCVYTLKWKPPRR